MLDVVGVLDGRLGVVNHLQHFQILIQLLRLLLISNLAIQAASDGIRIISLLEGVLLQLVGQFDLDVANVHHLLPPDLLRTWADSIGPRAKDGVEVLSDRRAGVALVASAAARPCSFRQI